ncbi:hypothetical protein CKA32_000408 [Geitlerinema sp. FC II]|nr:hypothetical protein CKA32_000408 [Geitlerinema sp. FC II]
MTLHPNLKLADKRQSQQDINFYTLFFRFISIQKYSSRVALKKETPRNLKKIAQILDRRLGRESNLRSRGFDATRHPRFKSNKSNE